MNDNKYYDSLFSKWHYDNMAPRHKAHKIDLLEYCQVCNRPLVFIDEMSINTYPNENGLEALRQTAEFCNATLMLLRSVRRHTSAGKEEIIKFELNILRMPDDAECPSTRMIDPDELSGIMGDLRDPHELDCAEKHGLR